MFSFKNIKGSPYSTILGIILIIGAIVSVFVVPVTWSEAIPVILLGMAFAGIKDPRNELPKDQ